MRRDGGIKEVSRREFLFRRLVPFLPSRSYLKTYLWILLMFALILLVLSYLFGRYLGSKVAFWGGLFIALMLAFVFGAVLLFGVLIHIIDREHPFGERGKLREKGKRKSP